MLPVATSELLAHGEHENGWHGLDAEALTWFGVSGSPS